MSERLVYSFGEGEADGRGDMKNVLGGKGAGLAEMTRLGIPVPPGFTLSTAACVHFFAHGAHPEGLKEAVEKALSTLEQQMGRRLGDENEPLLVSVRSGARVSMPGMMDTVLNLGLNDATIVGLSRAGDRFAWDAYRRFVQMYSDVVLGVPHHLFEDALKALKDERGTLEDTELTADDLRGLVHTYKEIVRTRTGEEFPQDPKVQLWGAIDAVFESWNNPHAVDYRKIEGIGDDWGTAVNVQAMVFGNMGDDCATGVAFTRDNGTGAPGLVGEWLLNAQGEDVVAGIRTPRPLNGDTEDTLEKAMPALYAQLDSVGQRLEAHFRDMQDLEFTVQQGHLYFLQTRTAKRTPRAAVRVACDLVDEGMIEPKEAMLRVDGQLLSNLKFSSIDEETARPALLTKGIPGSPGAVRGRIVFASETAVAWAKRGEPVILARPTTTPEDLAGMAAADGILTSQGGATSHAVLIARQKAWPCVAGAQALRLDVERARAWVGDVELAQGDWLTIDGSNGWVCRGRMPTTEAVLEGYAERLLGWADEHRRLGVRANADTPEDARLARLAGAEGIGLCRTEHMFFGVERITAVRRMILAEDDQQREEALAALLPHQRQDFEGIFEAMDGLPVTIRLLDPPLHEFLPHSEKDAQALATSMGIPVDMVMRRVRQLSEVNPMLGHRGCRLAISHPEIAQMQTRAIVGAACAVAQRGIDVRPEIMVPLVSMAGELELMRELVESVAQTVMAAAGVRIDLTIGTMIELPRAALTARSIAEHADFFSFGTNDLTQTMFGLSRDDSDRFLPQYLQMGLLPHDPFASLDPAVAAIVQTGIEEGRAEHPDLKVGICGEHGGDPASVAFFHRAQMDYVSCSPPRIWAARMAAAHAALADS